MFSIEDRSQTDRVTALPSPYVPGLFNVQLYTKTAVLNGFVQF